ncbi:Hypothetical protein R9X50_00598000 [Acrodontium crateriforme]|uniref:Organic hydroperoxide resistance protein n=1 Tax=Acrodontium crateriforme TaxID=150365 RepID=A0AAQ3RBX3_9PEZI|nr:Hypothetical protein R9X50_00598000 [Acrodontium crateriforme]
MASRTLQPLLRRAPRLISRPTTTPLNRYLNTASAPILYTAHASVTGARNGHVKGDEGLVVDLAMPAALGGSSDTGKTNPEELFAAGYGACFQSAMNASAASLGIKMPVKTEDSIVETRVHLVGDAKALDFSIRVDMEVQVRGMSKEDVEAVVAKAKAICPYSRATKGNVTTNVTITVL